MQQIMPSQIQSWTSPSSVMETGILLRTSQQLLLCHLMYFRQITQRNILSKQFHDVQVTFSAPKLLNACGGGGEH